MPVSFIGALVRWLGCNKDRDRYIGIEAVLDMASNVGAYGTTRDLEAFYCREE